MKLRWKFFLILMAFSLAPLLLVAGLSQQRLLRLGRNVSQEAASALTDIVTRELARSAETSARTVERERSALGFGLRALSHETRRALAAKPPTDADIFWAGDYEDPASMPADAKALPGYVRVGADGSRQPLRVSLEHQVFVLSPGVKAETVARDSARLTAIASACRKLSEAFGQTVYRVYVTLESGVTAVYPGFGGYPADFDPREATWYRQARECEDGEPFWSDLFVSMTTWQMFFTLTVPLTDAKGEFLGAAALDVPLTSFLREDELASQWSAQMRSFLVFPEKNEHGNMGLRVLARKDYQQQARLLLGQTLQWLEPPEDADFSVIVQDIEQRRSGSAQLPFVNEPAIWAYAPVGGQGLAFVLVVPREVALTLAEAFRQDVLTQTHRQLHLVVAAALIVLLAAALLGYLGSRAATRPITMLVEAWQRLGQGDFSTRLDLRVGDERDQLVDAFNETVPKLADHVRLSESMRLAREVQQSLLPASLPTPPGYEVAGTIEFCDETGGDYLDVFLQTGEDQQPTLAVIVGDVSGHGLAPALFMTTARAHLRSLAVSGLPLGRRVEEANRLLTEDMQKTFRFMTLFVAEVDTTRHCLRYVRCGHDPGLLYDPATDEFTELTAEGMALGFADKASFEERSWDLQPGQCLILATDGLQEAPNAAKERFGRDRFLEVVRTSAPGGAKAIQEALFLAVREFRGDAPVKDDMTVAVIRRLAEG